MKKRTIEKPKSSKQLTIRQKRSISAAVKKTVKTYGPALKKLAQT